MSINEIIRQRIIKEKPLLSEIEIEVLKDHVAYYAIHSTEFIHILDKMIQEYFLRNRIEN